MNTNDYLIRLALVTFASYAIWLLVVRCIEGYWAVPRLRLHRHRWTQEPAGSPTVVAEAGPLWECKKCGEVRWLSSREDERNG